MNHCVRRAYHHTRAVVHTLRARRILTKQKILLGALVCNILFIAIIITGVFTAPHTFVGATDLGLTTRASAVKTLQAIYETPIQMRIDQQQYELTYEHLGIYLDPQEALGVLFPNAPASVQSFVSYAKHLTTKQTVEIPLIFSQEFYDFIEKINEEEQKSEDIVYVDQEHKQAILYATKQPYRIDTKEFEDAIRAHFGSHEPILFVPITPTGTSKKETISSANARLASSYATPLTIIVGVGQKNIFLTLSPEDLKRYTTAHVSAGTGDAQFDINTDLLLPDLTTALSVYSVKINAPLVQERVKSGIRNALATRFAGGDAESIKVGIGNGETNTDGSIAKKYIEVDISQQKMYTFKDGVLVKTYRVSTGKDYPTPVGRFEILNKTGLGFSNIYNVWMPWWMGFSYSNELHAYFGIHELPYFYSGDDKIQRPQEFIGAPNTGGCVALDIGDAKEVYQFADIGTPVVIYQ